MRMLQFPTRPQAFEVPEAIPQAASGVLTLGKLAESVGELGEFKLQIKIGDQVITIHEADVCVGEDFIELANLKVNIASVNLEVVRED